MNPKRFPADADDARTAARWIDPMNSNDWVELLPCYALKEREIGLRIQKRFPADADDARAAAR